MHDWEGIPAMLSVNAFSGTHLNWLEFCNLSWTVVFIAGEDLVLRRRKNLNLRWNT